MLRGLDVSGKSPIKQSGKVTDFASKVTQKVTENDADMGAPLTAPDRKSVIVTHHLSTGDDRDR